MTPKVSISITAFNHEPYIAQAIESALMQRTDFPIEILIGEDQSVDRTRAIALRYQRLFPGIIRLFLHDHPPGYQRLNGRNNFLCNLNHARGEYIALLDGDDYWTDRKKLQKQANFLDRNRECSSCFHHVLIEEESARAPVLRGNSGGMKDRYYLEDIITGNFIYTCSVMFRKWRPWLLPNWYRKLPIGDWPLHVINAAHGGPIGFINSTMGVYRKRAHSVWSSRSRLQRYQICYQMLDTFDRYQKYRFHGRIMERKRSMLLQMFADALEEGDEPLCDEISRRLLRNPTVRSAHLLQLLRWLGDVSGQRNGPRGMLFRLIEKKALTGRFRDRIGLARIYLERGKRRSAFDLLAGMDCDDLPVGDRLFVYLHRHQLKKEFARTPDLSDAHAALSILLPKREKSDLDRYRIASLYQDIGDANRASMWFRLLLKRAKEIRLLSGAHFHLGFILENVGKIKTAQRHFRRCVELDPAHKAARASINNHAMDRTAVSGKAEG